MTKEWTLTKEKAKVIWERVGYDFEKCSCHECGVKETCDYVYDLYNTNGDCLALK